MSEENNAEERFEESVSEETVSDDAGTDEDKAADSKTFTQEELDGIIQRRLEKFKDYDDLKAQVEALRKEKEDGNWRTEVANEVRGEIVTEVNKRLLGAEALAQATTANFLYPEDAVRLIDTDALEYNDEGYVTPESVKAEIDRLTQERPALVRSDRKTTARDVGLGTGGHNKPLNAEEAFVQSLSN